MLMRENWVPFKQKIHWIFFRHETELKNKYLNLEERGDTATYDMTFAAG